MKVEVIHISDKVLYSGLANHVLLPGVLGEFEVGENHAPIIALLTQGKMMIRPSTEETVKAKRSNRMGPENQFVMIKQGVARFDGEVLYAVVE